MKAEILSEEQIEEIIKDIANGWKPDDETVKDLVISHELLRQQVNNGT